MKQAVVLLVVVGALAAMAAAAPQAGAGGPPPVQFICDRDECSCSREDRLEVVTCDCSGAASQQPLLLGERSNAHLSDRTKSLRVRHCADVSLVTDALANAFSLNELELSDIARLELREGALHTDEGSQRRVALRRVADLQVHPQAFRGVTRIHSLELSEVVAGDLPLDSFVAGADVVSLRLSDSRAGAVSINFRKADAISVANCTLAALSADVGDVLSVQIADNTLKRVDALRFNVRSNSHSTNTNNVTLARNTVSSMDADDVRMSTDTFALVNNTFGSLTAPLRVEFTTARVTGNEVGLLGAGVFDEFVRLEALDLRGFPGASTPAELAFTFADNTLRAAGNGSYGRFLSPAEEEARQTALFRVYGNRFACRCDEMAELVRAGEASFLAAERDAAAADDDGLAQIGEVYGELYRTSRCVEGDRPLRQYRLTAYDGEFACQASPDPATGAAAAAAAGLPLLLLMSAVTAAGLAA